MAARPDGALDMLALLFSVTVFELFVGGGGRWIAAGPVTLRMVLFVACLIVGWVAALVPRRNFGGLPLAIGFALAYLLIHLPALIDGAVRGTDISIMFTELQQSLYWLAAPFFACTLASTKYIQRTASLVQLSGVFMATVFIAIVVALAKGYLNFTTFYLIVHENGEVVSRGGGLMVYKGDLYLGICLVFLVAIRGKYWLPAAMLVSVALVLTLTRGFILSTSAAILMLLAVQRRKAALLVGLVLVAAAVGMVWYYFPSLVEGLTSARSISNQQRLDDMDFIMNHVSLKTVLLGEGFGSLIDGRIQIENTFLWVVWKLGVVGLAFWLAPLVLCVVYFLGGKKSHENPLACAFLFGTVLIYIQTLSNPYLNNPIGLSFVIVSVFALRTLCKAEGQDSPSTSRVDDIAPSAGVA